MFTAVYNNVTDLRLNNASQMKVTLGLTEQIAFLNDQLRGKDDQIAALKNEKMSIDEDGKENKDDQSERLRSVVVAGLGESNKQDANERYTDDIDEVKDLLKIADTQTSFTAYRMGKPKTTFESHLPRQKHQKRLLGRL